MLLADFLLGYSCNLRCSGCLEQDTNLGFTSSKMTSEEVARSLKYLQFAKIKYPEIDEFIIVLFGGEPLLYTDLIQQIADYIKNKSGFRLSIVTNGTLIEQNLEFLIKLKNDLQSKLNKVIVSYDFNFQEKHKGEGTYEKVRNSIRLLSQNNFPVETISLIHPYEFTEFDLFAQDFLELRKEVPELRSRINIQRMCSAPDIDEEGIRSAITRAKEILKDIPDEELKTVFFPNHSLRKYNGFHEAHSTGGMMFAGFVPGGEVLPSYSVSFNDAVSRNLLVIGNVSEDYKILDKKHEDFIEMIKQYKPDEECASCTALCRIFPNETVKTSLDEYYAHPAEDYCKIRKLITECMTWMN